MNNYDYIDSFFKNNLLPDEAKLFRDKIESDPGFAEEVAFYLTALEVSRQEANSDKKQRFREIYQKQGYSSRGYEFRKWAYSLAIAAVVAGLVFGAFLFTRSDSKQQLAEQYFREHLQTLPVQMGGHSDSLQTAIELYNQGNTAEALVKFEKMIQSDTSNDKAINFAGIAALRLKQYDRALMYFEQLETHSKLFSNPALLHQAVTLIERNHAGDEDKAKRILQRVAGHDLEGRETAQEWLNKW